MNTHWVAFLGLLSLGAAHAQTLRHDQLAAGKFLVAPRKALDPNFAETVVLIVQYDDDSTMGLIINQPSRGTVGQLFPQKKGLSGERVYVGGPVGRSGMLGLLRTKEKPADAQHIFEDVYLVADKKLFHESLATGAENKSFRVYLGYSGWAPGQLENELDNDMWHLFEGDVKTLFDRAPESIWPRLVRRTELNIALTFFPSLRSRSFDSPVVPIRTALYRGRSRNR
ncbi:MAG: YqgE/AlgH family protein [Acidobacteria bacterium]|nr:YqgE/AlgH family protein [Acidobacteriota bacterium]